MNLRPLSRGVIIMHDNVTLYTAGQTRLLLDDFQWDVFDHPPHSPDITPFNFNLFCQKKRDLDGVRFTSNKE